MKFPRRLRGVAYSTFYRLPGTLRRTIARTVAPKYLVGAVAVIRDSEAAGPGRLLLLRQPRYRGWNLPAGLLKKREQPHVGAARELFEESGVRIDPSALSPGTPNAIIHTVGVVDTVWFGEVAASAVELKVDGGEVLDAAWWPIDDLPDLTVNTSRLLKRYGIGPEAAK